MKIIEIDPETGEKLVVSKSLSGYQQMEALNWIITSWDTETMS